MIGTVERGEIESVERLRVVPSVSNDARLEASAAAVVEAAEVKASATVEEPSPERDDDKADKRETKSLWNESDKCFR